MKVRAIAPYAGSKRDQATGRGMALGIVDALTANRTRWPKLYVEPFHGSLAVLLAMREAGYTGKAIVNDLYGLIHNLAEVLADDYSAASLHRELSTVLFHEAVFCSSCEWLRDMVAAGPLVKERSTVTDYQEAAAYHYMIASWMYRNGEAGLDLDWSKVMGSFCCRYTQSGGDPAKRWTSVVESIPAWWRLLRESTQFLCRDAIRVLAKIEDAPGTVIYCDSPYLKGTCSIRYAVDVSDDTNGLHEKGDFHSMLACELRSRRHSPVVVSYYAHERIARLYPGWKIIEIERSKNTANARRGAGKTIATEVLVMNPAAQEHADP